MHVFARSIVETVRHPLLILDASLRLEDANPAFFQTFHVNGADAIGRPIHELDGGLWEVAPLRAVLAGALEGRSSDELEVDHDFPGAGRRVLRLAARRVVHDDGSPRVLLTLEDVTEKVRAREALQRLNRELEARVNDRTARLEAANRELEAFCYSVSHDLRVPLRALDGFSDELLRSYGERLDDKGRHYLERLRAGTQRMGGLIDDLLQLSRLSRGEIKRDRVDLSALVEEIVEELRRREPERRVEFVVQPRLDATGDPGLLKIALDNLLGNAWKFTSRKPAARIEFGRTTRDAGATFFVRDDGAGFDMAHAAKLFGAFQRLHSEREFPGNGVGLATVQRIVRRHGGRVWAEGEPNRGATFYFELPAGSAA